MPGSYDNFKGVLKCAGYLIDPTFKDDNTPLNVDTIIAQALDFIFSKEKKKEERERPRPRPIEEADETWPRVDRKPIRIEVINGRVRSLEPTSNPYVT